jgi:uncharacterized protein YbcV (DUF1398 family)
MTDLITILDTAVARGTRLRPRVGGFPYLAESLRQAGVHSYRIDVPSASVVYVTDGGAVLRPGAPLFDDWTEIAGFDELALVDAIRTDQRGESTFPEFVRATFAAGVISYLVDTRARTCTYLGARGERYVEEYPAVDLPAA